ncbi:MAG: RNA methyltransferase [Bacteroidota bacterium]|nr:RNA methyltransferase [Bacteroidota bacterium]
MLTKSRLSLLRALRQKKYRNDHGLFVAEGDKLVPEILQSSFAVETVYATEEWMKENSKIAKNAREVITVSKDELTRISSLVTPQRVLAVAVIPQYTLDETELLNTYSLLLDGIRDPGNLGTIIRIADWFGIKDIICSPDSAEAWNPKVVQASMGSLLRVRIHEMEPVQFLQNLEKASNGKMPVVYGTFMEGESIYQAKFNSSGVIVIGNEANGISAETEKLIGKKITIPFVPLYNNEKGRPESLNAAVAAAIVCAEVRRMNTN